MLFLGFFLGNTALFAQISFTDQSALLTPAKHYNGVAMAVLDMDGDGLDDILRLNNANELNLELQTLPNRSFIHQPIPTNGSGLRWGICAGDVDNNGRPDILFGGNYNGTYLLKANANGSAYTSTKLAEPGTFVQSVNMADMNNDGYLDAFVCHDDGPSRFFINNGMGQMAYTPNFMDYTTLPVSDNSGNYGAVWCDIDNDGDQDLYVAKCRQNITDPTDGRRINMLFWNNGDGTYTQDLDNTAGLRIGAQSWTADFGDIDNDGDFDCFITNHDVSSQLLENDGAGHFTDITAFSGLYNGIQGLPIQGDFRDFDNDGWVDILVAGTANYLFHNNGNKTFTELPNLFGNKIMESYALGDLNHDGFQDIYAGYANTFNQPSNIPDALWINTGNANHFFGLNLRGVESNHSAVGARVTLYSALGIQIREVRAGESYGIAHSMQIHIGLDSLTQVDSVRVKWPSGKVEMLLQPAIDQYLTLEEGHCLLAPLTILASGPSAFCAGDSVSLSTVAAFASYHWNTNDTTAQILVKTSGLYRVTVTDATTGCTQSSAYYAITVNPDETPKVTIEGEKVFCEGATVTLHASPAATYHWNTGDTTQSIVVIDAGKYTVTIPGLCGSFTSVPAELNIYPNPLPQVQGDTVSVNGIAHLAAEGSNLSWYNAASSDTVIGTGPAFQTGPLTENDTLWVSNAVSYDAPNVFTGMNNQQGTVVASSGFNGAVIFDCFKACKLVRTKVFADFAGIRNIELRNSNNEVLQSKMIDIPVGSSVITLDFDLPEANNLVLTTNTQQNVLSFSTISPQLRRSDNGVAYPYVVPDVLTINRSNTPLGTDYYYYFYHWEIDFYAHDCVTPRVPVVAVVDSNIVAVSAPQPRIHWQLFPNPAEEVLYIQADQSIGNEGIMVLYNAQGAVLRSTALPPVDGTLRWKFDLNGLPAGIYFVELYSENGSERQKLVVR